MAKTKDMSLENRVNIVTEKLIAASRKAIQSATPVEALAVWKLIKTQQLGRIPGLTLEQVQSLVETQAKELGADCIVATSKASTNTPEAARENNPPDTGSLPTSPADSNIEGAGGANGTKAKTAIGSKSK
ncbi:hypothetical protein H6G81_15615 [Scytonema hofmannii FACHB-248]|uniref:Uncharacterized protein n=1 Tax=Scytonema hofmannii FACHB-248 TaxID=1842502 RepID=A0ABR8GT38_9CYAN|nr:MULTISPECIES: hypothetical protein [Nostocales]MBD2605908.1 hypothetical protein [Scytonema hofmannii FACHB-248]